MKRGADFQPHDAAGSSGLGEFHRAIHRTHVARDHDLVR